MASSFPADDESASLLGASSSRRRLEIVDDAVVRRKLYASHFLSTWNSRFFEFGVLLYLAAIYPGTLLPMSGYAVIRGLSAVVFAPLVGWYIDTGDRLQVVTVSIVSQRLAVAASCLVFYMLTTNMLVIRGFYDDVAILALLSVLACIEKLGSIMNLVAVERDWVVVIAGENETALAALNSQMRRIDLCCKLLGPPSIALVVGVSTELGVLTNCAMNLASLAVEYSTLAQVYHSVPALKEQKAAAQLPEVRGRDPAEGNLISSPSTSGLAQLREGLATSSRNSAACFALYFRHRAFLASIAGALLYLTVLSFAGQMVTYLLAAGFSSTQISIARTVSVLIEMLATWTAPWLMGMIGPVRAGLWLANWQVFNLAAGLAVSWVYGRDPLVSAGALVVGTILSRVGLWGFDLCVQIIVQQEVESDDRGAFSSAEAAFQNMFELLSFASTMVFSRPDQFKWPALISVAAVTTASAIYASFVQRRRGHLVHFDVLGKLDEFGRWSHVDRVES